MRKINNFIQFVRRQPRWKLAVAAGVLVLFAWITFGRGKAAVNGITFAARRGDLQISVLEGGSIEALESQEIRSEVKGGQGTKILKIVEEGYQVTDDDVKNGKVLVELDSADLKDKITQEDIQFQTTLATLTEATQTYEIQVNQNETDIKAAEKNAKFARMDVEKFLSDVATKEIFAQLNLYEVESSNTNTTATDAQLVDKDVPEGGGDVAPIKVNAEETSQPVTTEPATQTATVESNKPVPVDYAKYAHTELLGDGAAQQQLRKLLDDLQVAEQQAAMEKAKLEGTERLFKKGFVNKTDLETEEMTFQNCQLKVQTAVTARDLFIKYEFPKQAEQFVSVYGEALRGLDRAKREAVSKLAQSRARLKSAEGRYNIEVNQCKELNEQLGKCTIRAQKTGLVVYGGGNNDRYGGYEQIREGATVRERQPIITIPDMKQMALNVKIHESYIKKVSKGLKARIQVDAFPEEKLTGEVIKVAVLPDSQNRYFSPDLKVYVTSISIDGMRDWVKPGMSAKVEILVNELRDAVYIPLQSISPMNGKQFCYVVNHGNAEAREVEVGDFNDDFIEIKSGLKEGEKVLLNPPASEKREENNSEKNSDESVPAKSTKPASA